MSRMDKVQRVDSNKRMSHAGFTLIETLIAVVIISIGIASLLIAFSRGVFISQDASDLYTGTSLAQVKMEELKDTAFGSIDDDPRMPVTGFSGFERAVDVTGIYPDELKQVDVTVYWTTKGGELSTTLTTYFVNN